MIQNLEPVTPPTPPQPQVDDNGGPQEHVPYQEAYAYDDVDGVRRIGTLEEARAASTKRHRVTLATATATAVVETAGVFAAVSTAEVYAELDTATVAVKLETSDE
jgi:hypothetical protein